MNINEEKSSLNQKGANLIVMLIQGDLTVSDAREKFIQCKDSSEKEPRVQLYFVENLYLTK